MTHGCSAPLTERELRLRMDGLHQPRRCQRCHCHELWYGSCEHRVLCHSSPEAQAHCDEFAAEDEEFFSKIWPWTTPIEQCIDGRTDVKCTSFQDWTNAWLTVKG
jgi:hypothetical protein